MFISFIYLWFFNGIFFGNSVVVVLYLIIHNFVVNSNFSCICDNTVLKLSFWSFANMILLCVQV